MGVGGLAVCLAFLDYWIISVRGGVVWLGFRLLCKVAVGLCLSLKRVWFSAFFLTPRFSRPISRTSLGCLVYVEMEKAIEKTVEVSTEEAFKQAIASFCICFKAASDELESLRKRLADVEAVVVDHGVRLDAGDVRAGVKQCSVNLVLSKLSEAEVKTN